MDNNPVKVFMRNYLIDKVSEREKNPFDVSISFFNAVITTTVAPLFLITTAMFFVIEGYPVVREKNLDIIILSFVTLACAVLSIVLTVYDKRRWKQEGVVLKDHLTKVENTPLDIDHSLTNVHQNVVVTKCEIVEQQLVPLCSLDIRLSTGEVITSITSVRSPVLAYMLQQDLAEYSLEEVHINSGYLIEYTESYIMQKQRLEQEELLCS